MTGDNVPDIQVVKDPKVEEQPFRVEFLEEVPNSDGDIDMTDASSEEDFVDEENEVAMQADEVPEPEAVLTVHAMEENNAGNPFLEAALEYKVEKKEHDTNEEEEPEVQDAVEEPAEVPLEDTPAIAEETVVPPPVVTLVTEDVEQEDMVSSVEEKTLDWEPVKPEGDMVTMGVPTKEKSAAAEEIHETTTASGWTQVRALVEKNFLTKVRTPGASVAEMFSPVLLMLVLWISYNMSDVVKYKGKTYHAIRVDIPFFWDSGIYHEDEAEDFDLSDTHRRHLMTMEEGEGLQAVDYGLEEGNQEANKWNWGRLLQGLATGGMEPGEDMGMIGDFLMMNHLRRLQSDGLDDIDMLTADTFEDDTVEFEEVEEADSGDWWEEVLTDIKKETVDKVEWDQVVDEIKDNFGEIWDDTKDYLFISTYSTAYYRLNQLRLRLKDFLRRPIVVPTFGQYVWASKLIGSFINVRRNLPRALVDSSYGRQWGNLLTLGTIHLTPRDHPMTQKFIKYLEETYPAATANVLIRTHVDHDEAMNYVMDHLDGERTWALIDLAELSDGTNDQIKGGSFTIRLNYTTVPNTALIQNYVATGLSTKYQRYYLSGYLTLQRTINDFIMAQEGCDPAVDPFFSMPMPVADYEQNIFFLHVGYLLGLVLVMALLYPTSRLIQSLVEERETRMKETLLILGVRPWAHTTSWVMTSSFTFLFITMFMSIILRHILRHQSFMMIWLWMGLFGLSSMAFCFFLASFFSKAKLAAVIGPMALFASLLPRFIFFGTNRYEAVGAKYAASILPGTALAFGADIIGDYEYGEQPVSDSMWIGAYSFGGSLSFLLFDTIFYMFLAWYTEQVIPREYGAAPKPWYFPLLWFYPRCFVPRYFASDNKTVADSDDELSVSSLEKPKALNEDCIESVNDPALVPRVFIKDLVKAYNRKQTKPSVDNLNLTLYESQITALLGHNGAGKTTTVSVLTGLFPPTSGDVSIYGHSVVDEVAKARQSIGICPQHNVLFDRLTVMEHMEFFSKIKGVPFDVHDLKQRAFELGLSEDQLRTTAAALSGGNKRKLSVAIALCGNPKFLILDEPTSAMDPTARRRTWQVLRKKRAGRVTLLTTHFMDEAEHLSDRVAVLKQGELQCCGSPLYLKDKFNLGWNSAVVMEKPEQAEGADDEYSGSQLRITSFLQQYVPGATLVRRSGRELTFCFPKGSEDLFPECFDAFERQAKDLGVSSYGIENASFEEVFLMLAEMQDSSLAESKDDEVSLAETGSILTDTISRVSLSDSESVASSKFTVESGETEDSDNSFSADVSKVDTLKLKDMENYKSMSAIRQIGLLYWKRFTVQKRDAKGAFFAILLPVLLVALVVLVLTTNIVVAGPPIEMSPGLYKDAYSTSGEASTQVLVAGGYSAPDKSAVHSEFLFMDSGLSHDYPNAQFKNLEKVSSSQLSRYLLDTYNDHDHPTRFGAFSIADGVQVNINLNFTAFNDQIEYYSNKLMVHGDIKLRDQRIDLMEVLGIAGTNGRFYWLKTVADFEQDFYSWSNMSPHVKVRTVELHKITQSAINNIMYYSSSDYEEEVRTLADNLYSNVEAFLRSREVQELKANTTKIYDEFVGEAKKIWDNSSQIESELGSMIKEFVRQGFENKGTKKKPIYRWQGNLDSLVRDFVKDLGDLGENPNTNTLSVYGLIQKLLEDMKSLVNGNMDAITGHNYTVDSLQQALVDAFEAEDKNFDRKIILHEISSIIRGVAQQFGYQDVDALETITRMTDWVEDRLVDYSDGSIGRIPDRVFVAPLIFLDHVLGKWDFETISPDEAFGYLSEILGGNRRKKDGFVQFRAKDIILDFAKLEVDIQHMYLTTGHGTLLDIDEEYSLRFALDSLQEMLPTNTSSLVFEFEVPAKTSLLHNSSSPHAVAAFNQAYMEHRYKQCLGDVRGAARLVSVNHPLPLTAKQSLEIKVMLSVLAGLFILIPFCYIPATFIVFLVRERVSKSKHLQLVSGVNMSAYWIAAYLWDLTLYAVLSACIMIVFLFYGNSAQVFIGTREAFLCTCALVFGYGVSSLPFSYLLSRYFSNSSTAQISVAGIGWLTGFVTVISYVTMVSIEKTEHIAIALQPWFRLFPAYHVGEGFMNMSISFWEREILGYETYPSQWDVTGRSIAMVFSLSLPYFFLVLVFEYANDGGAGGLLGRGLRAISYQWTKLLLKWHGIRMSVDEEDGACYSLLGNEEGKLDNDEDVVRERQYVTKNGEELRQTAPVLLNNLWKIYPPSVGVLGGLFLRIRGLITSVLCFLCKNRAIVALEDAEEAKTFVPKQAVRGVSTAIKKGETYALLGANGAGKTTTMGMLTGDISSTNGSAYIAGHNATGGSNNGVSEARRNIGFCPQKDPLLDLMTGRETLTMFARLRGVPPQQVKSVVDELLDRLTLTPHADKVTRAYSGGNKRKLSLGLALIGDPKVLLIDESSSGLDPLAKRKMWDLIEEAARCRSVILTTHSMQEAEALCTRIAIMVKGQFVCLGSVQHLKSKYLDGYSVDVFCKSTASDDVVDRVAEKVLQALPGSSLSERHGRFLRLEVSNVSRLGLGTCFRRLQELKNDPDLDVENYSVSQCSLEHVFVKLVNADDNNNPRDDDTEHEMDWNTVIEV